MWILYDRVCIASLNFKNYFATAFLGICQKVTMHLPMSSTFHRHNICMKHRHFQFGCCEFANLFTLSLSLSLSAVRWSSSLLFAMMIIVAYFGFSHSNRFFGWNLYASKFMFTKEQHKKGTDNYCRKLNRLDGIKQILQKQQQKLSEWGKKYPTTYF